MKVMDAARDIGLVVSDGDVAGTTCPGEGATTQLRCRSEIADLFTDLAIDVGLRRHHQELVAAV